MSHCAASLSCRGKASSSSSAAQEVGRYLHRMVAAVEQEELAEQREVVQVGGRLAGRLGCGWRTDGAACSLSVGRCRRAPQPVTATTTGAAPLPCAFVLACSIVRAGGIQLGQLCGGGGRVGGRRAGRAAAIIRPAAAASVGSISGHGTWAAASGSALCSGCLAWWQPTCIRQLWRGSSQRACPAAAGTAAPSGPACNCPSGSRTAGAYDYPASCSSCHRSSTLC